MEAMSTKMNAQAQLAKKVAKRRKRRLIAIAVIGWGLFILTAFYYSNPGTWSTDPAPPMTPWYVTTKAYVGKDGHWRSMDTGEKITVTHWTTKDY